MKTVIVHVRKSPGASSAIGAGGLMRWVVELAVAMLGLACFAAVAFAGLLVDVYTDYVASSRLR